jgi:hypothetical protein
MSARSRQFWLLFLTLIELGVAVYLVAGIAPALADLSPVTIPVTTTSTTTPGVTTTTVSASSGSTTTVGSGTTVASTSATAAQPIRAVHVFGIDWKKPTAELLDLILVIALAGIGSSIHGLTSLTTFIGNRRFVSSWTSWYVIRLPVGVAIAVLFYFVVRAGFVTVASGATSLNPYGLGAMGGLAGMFSKQATDKLRDVFDTAFNTSGDSQRQDKADGGVTVDHATPASLPVGTNDRAVRIFGQGFYAATTSNVNGDARALVAHDSTQIAVTLKADDVAAPGVVTINLVAPGPAPAPSTTVDIRIRPQISEIRANDEHDLTPHILGDGFTEHSEVYVAGQNATIVDRDPDNAGLTVQVTPDQYANRNDLQVVVRNPANEGGESDPMSLSSVTNWPPR